MVSLCVSRFACRIDKCGVPEAARLPRVRFPRMQCDTFGRRRDCDLDEWPVKRNHPETPFWVSVITLMRCQTRRKGGAGQEIKYDCPHIIDAPDMTRPPRPATGRRSRSRGSAFGWRRLP